MRCPKCGRVAGQMDHVITDENEVYRELYCKSCDHKFYTIEYEVERNNQFAKEWKKYHTKKQKMRIIKDYGIR